MRRILDDAMGERKRVQRQPGQPSNRIEHNVETLEALYKTSIEQGKFHAKDFEGELTDSVKIKFKDQTARDETAAKLKALIGALPLEVLANEKQDEGISKKSLIIQGTSPSVNAQFFTYFRKLSRDTFINDRVEASKRAAALEMRVQEMLTARKIENAKLKLKGDRMDWQYAIASKEVDLFTAFSATTSDHDMEERFAALKRQDEHRRSIELDSAAYVRGIALVAEIKSLPEQKDSVWAWHAHGYASAIHKYVLKSGLALKQAYLKQPTHVLPVMVVNRTIKDDEMKERKISPALIAALELPGFNGTPKDLKGEGLERVLHHITQVAQFRAKYHRGAPEPASLENSREAALEHAHFAHRYASPIITIEEFETLLDQLAAEPLPAENESKTYTVNGTTLTAFPAPKYAGALVFKTPWPDKQLRLPEFVDHASKLLTEEGRGYAYYYAMKRQLVERELKTDQMTLFNEPDLEQLMMTSALQFPKSSLYYHVVELVQKNESIPSLLTLRHFADAFVAALDKHGEEAARAIASKTAEMLRDDGNAEQAKRIEEVITAHKIFGPFAREFCYALDHTLHAESMAHRFKCEDPKRIVEKPHLDGLAFWKLKDKMKKNEFEALAKAQLAVDEAHGNWHSASECCRYLYGPEWRKREVKHLLRSQGSIQHDFRLREAALELLGIAGEDAAHHFRATDDLLKPLLDSKEPSDWEIAAVICYNTGYGSGEGSIERAKALWKKSLEHHEKAGEHSNLRHAAWLARERLHDTRKYIELLKRSGDERELAKHYHGKGKFDKAIEIYTRLHITRPLPQLYAQAGRLEDALNAYLEEGDSERVISLAYKLGKHDLVDNEIRVLKARLESHGQEGKAYIGMLEEMFGDARKALPFYEAAGMHGAAFELALNLDDKVRADAAFEPALREYERAGQFAKCAYLCRKHGDEPRAQFYQTFLANFTDKIKAVELRKKFEEGIAYQTAKAAELRGKGDLEEAKRYEELVKRNTEVMAENEQIFSERNKRHKRTNGDGADSEDE
jgi:hypothetical protein